MVVLVINIKNMKQAIIAILAVLLVGSLVLLFTSQSTEAPTMDDEVMNASTQTSEETTTSDTETSDRGSLADMFALGNNVRCEYSSTVEGEVSEGTFYTDGERFRVESTYTGTEETVTSNMINDGAFVYTWGNTPNGAMAIKMPVEETEVSNDEQVFMPTNSDARSYVNMEEEVEYDCDRWNVDASLFVPPSDVEFTDMEAMMQNMQQGLPEGFQMPQ
jgi:hypothetical protein